MIYHIYLMDRRALLTDISASVTGARPTPHRALFFGFLLLWFRIFTPPRSFLCFRAGLSSSSLIFRLACVL